MKEILDKVDLEMSKTITALNDYIKTIRTGRASSSMLDKVLVNYYGDMTPLNQTAQITVPEPQLIVIKPYERKMVSEIVGGINKADLDLNPIADAEVVRIKIPSLTEDIRKDLVKKMYKESETFKVRIRNARRDGITSAKSNKDVSEDWVKEIETDVQELTNRYIKKIDELVKNKETELMKI